MVIMMIEQRPNPDELLSEIQRDEAKQRQGRLKIFFGSCAGVGKTFGMLEAAQRLREKNIDVVVGLVESHGREETAELLDKLEILSTKSIEYRSKSVMEFDLDAALARKPSVILIDELAHSNVSGSRHNKRWQDIKELLDAGITVYSTLNVQHIESLNDVVGQITGIRVFETIPDQVFDNADDVTLVDLSPEELIERLTQGKIYVPELTQQAIQHFFRKGNLIALRELALRRMADRVDLQMQEYRTDQDIQPVWQAKERLLICVGPDKKNGALVRKTYRLASHLRADWMAIYVETPVAQKFSTLKRQQILKDLKLAQELGADTHVLGGSDIGQTLTTYARSHNVTKIVVGTTQRSKFFRLFNPSLSEYLIDQISDIDIYVVGLGPESEKKQYETTPGVEIVSKPHMRGYIWASIFCGLITLLSSELTRYLDLTNIAMLYLLGVVIVAVRYGRGPAIFTSFVSVAAFDFFFVPTPWSFDITDSEYLITFSVMLIVALTISHLTANLRYQARIAMHRERRMRAIYTLNKELSVALTLAQMLEISRHHIETIFQAKIAILLSDSHGKIHLDTETELTIDLGVAQWVSDHREAAGLGTQTLPASPLLYCPLKTPLHQYGVVALSLKNYQEVFLPEQQRLLDNFIAQTAFALERLKKS
jgi:two-component system sensor histidine kinase KdpD